MVRKIMSPKSCRTNSERSKNSIRNLNHKTPTINIANESPAARASTAKTSFEYTYGIGPRPTANKTIKIRISTILTIANASFLSSGFFAYKILYYLFINGIL
jgi:hypothetical protein